MSNRHKHISNVNYEEAVMTSRQTSRHGLSRGQVRAKKYYNRIGKRADARFAFSTQDV